MRRANVQTKHVLVKDKRKRSEAWRKWACATDSYVAFVLMETLAGTLTATQQAKPTKTISCCLQTARSEIDQPIHCPESGVNHGLNRDNGRKTSRFPRGSRGSWGKPQRQSIHGLRPRAPQVPERTAPDLQLKVQGLLAPDWAALQMGGQRNLRRCRHLCRARWSEDRSNLHRAQRSAALARLPDQCQNVLRRTLLARQEEPCPRGDQRPKSQRQCDHGTALVALARTRRMDRQFGPSPLASKTWRQGA